jgi:O-antigen chain-terminating methyltransferase
MELHYRLDGNPLLRRVFSKRHRSEIEAIERELNSFPPVGPEWHDFHGGNRAVGSVERVVEIPWVLSRWTGARRVLDIGTAFAYSLYVRRLQRMGIPELHGLDLGARRIKGIRMVRGDVRRMPYLDHSFDLILCVSTLEHIGFDNSRYTAAQGGERVAGDIAALNEMRRVLARGGRIIVTVPFGKLEVRDWFRQYDMETWKLLIAETGLAATEQKVFAHGADGWKPADPASLRLRGYAEGVPGAAGVLCAVLQAVDGAPDGLTHESAPGGGVRAIES